jgi:ketosteroid isomerase-like protein
MSGTPRAVAESYWAAESRRDLGAILDHYHEDAVFRPPGQTLRGHDEIRTFYEDSAASYPGLEVRITHEIRDGMEASLEWEAVLTDHDGARHPLRGVNNVLVEDGRFREVRAYFDPATLDQTL